MKIEFYDASSSVTEDINDVKFLFYQHRAFPKKEFDFISKIDKYLLKTVL